MRLREVIDKLRFGDSTKKNVNILNKLIDQVNSNTEHIILPDNDTLRIIQLYGEERLAANIEILTLNQFQMLNNGQTVVLDNGREIVFDDTCFYVITDDNGNSILNNLYSRVDYGMIRGWAENLICDQTEDPVPTLKYLYAYYPIDGPVIGHPLYTCRVTKMSTDFIEIEATDLYTGYSYVTVKRDGIWSDWIASTAEFITARGDIHYHVSMDGSDIEGDGTQELPYATIQRAISMLPSLRGEYTYYIHLKSGTYEGFTVDDLDIELCGYEDASQTVITFTSAVNIVNGATLNIADEISSVNFFISTLTGNALNIKRNSSAYIPSNMVVTAAKDEPTNKRIAIAVANGSHCTIYKSLIITGFDKAIDCKTSSQMFVDAITLNTCNYGITSDRNGNFSYNEIKCTNVKKQFLSSNGSTITRGNQVNGRRIIVGDISGLPTQIKPLTYKVASIDIVTPSRHITTSFRVCNASSDIDEYGILTASLALNESCDSIVCSQLYWEYASYGIYASNGNRRFYMVYRLVNNILHADIYVDITTPWLSYYVEVINDITAFTPTPYPIEQWELNPDITSSGPVNPIPDPEIDHKLVPSVRGYQIDSIFMEYIKSVCPRVLYNKEVEYEPVLPSNIDINITDTGDGDKTEFCFNITEDCGYSVGTSTFLKGSTGTTVDGDVKFCLMKYGVEGYTEVISSQSLEIPSVNKVWESVEIGEPIHLSAGSYALILTSSTTSSQGKYALTASVNLNLTK